MMTVHCVETGTQTEISNGNGHDSNDRGDISRVSRMQSNIGVHTANKYSSTTERCEYQVKTRCSSVGTQTTITTTPMHDRPKTRRVHKYVNVDECLRLSSHLSEDDDTDEDDNCTTDKAV
uniref:Uncharacterized protein n=1 Tax=Lygus hesperus TaxID=30085 RepID=A0A146LF12_LYGHE